MTPGLHLFAPSKGTASWECQSRIQPGSALLCALICWCDISSLLFSRAYMSVKELKEALQLNSTHFLNVYFASSVREDLAGAATWPWDKEAISHLGK